MKQPKKRIGLQVGELLPIPDPTRLTTEAVDRAGKQFHRELTQLHALVEARLDGTDKLLTERVQVSGRIRAEVEEKITHLRELTEARLAAIDRRFEDRDLRAAEIARSGRDALAAALEAARQLNEVQIKANDEAITKAEVTTNEKIKALEQVTLTSRRALEDKIDDARTRLTAIEALTRGIKETAGETREGRTEHRADRTLSMQTLVTVITGLSVLIGLISVILLQVRH